LSLEVSGEVLVERPILEVFYLFADLEKSHEYSSPVIERTKITEGPAGLGTKYRARDKWPGREVEFIVEITEFSPPNRLGATWSAPMAGGWQATFSGVASGTLVRFAATMKPSGVLALLTPILRPWARRQTGSFLTSFKAWAESQSLTESGLRAE
jgi:uncharacterized protein YndB with AHSA1/START domain